MRCRMNSLVSVALVIGALLLASCSIFPSEGPTTPDTSAKSAPSAKPYGSLAVAADFGTLRSFDPQADSAMAMRGPVSAIFDSVLFEDSASQLKPGIAERWEISPDGMNHTFYIRKGVKFH